MTTWKKIDCAIWYEKPFRKLNQRSRDLLFYMMTGPHTAQGVPGVWYVGAKEACCPPGMSDKEFKSSLRELAESKMAFVDDEALVLYVPIAMSMNPPQNPKTLGFWAKMLGNLPQSALVKSATNQLQREVSEMSANYQAVFSETLSQHQIDGNRFCSSIEIEIERETEIETELEKEKELETQIQIRKTKNSAEGANSKRGEPPNEQCGEVLEYYRERKRKHQRSDKPIRCRWPSGKEGEAVRQVVQDYGVEDTKAAIDGLFQSKHHLGENDRNTQYLDLKYIAKSSNFEKFRDTVQRKQNLWLHEWRVAILNLIEPYTDTIPDELWDQVERGVLKPGTLQARAAWMMDNVPAGVAGDDWWRVGLELLAENKKNSSKNNGDSGCTGAQQGSAAEKCHGQSDLSSVEFF